jgi:hypothetical protein
VMESWRSGVRKDRIGLPEGRREGRVLRGGEVQDHN